LIKKHNAKQPMQCMATTERTESRNGFLPSLFAQNEVDVGRASDRQQSCCGEDLEFFWADNGRCVSLCRKCGQRFTDSTQVRYGGSPWIGVDLDGTLARVGGNGQGDKIGTPIKPMMDRVMQWIADGKTVKIFTARASSSNQVAAIKQWLAKHGLPDLEVTNIKDMLMTALWDDRCVQVLTNSGEPVKKTPPGTGRRQSASHGLRGLGRRLDMFSRIRIFLTL
jgi:hypothetical protein